MRVTKSLTTIPWRPNNTTIPSNIGTKNFELRPLQPYHTVSAHTFTNKGVCSSCQCSAEGTCTCEPSWIAWLLDIEASCCRSFGDLGVFRYSHRAAAVRSVMLILSRHWPLTATAVTPASANVDALRFTDCLNLEHWLCEYFWNRNRKPGFWTCVPTAGAPAASVMVAAALGYSCRHVMP